MTAGPSSQWFQQHLNQQPPPDSQPRAWQLRLTGDGKAKDELPESASAPMAGDSPSPARAAGMATAHVRSSASPRKPKAGRAQLTQTTYEQGLSREPPPGSLGLNEQLFFLLSLHMRFVFPLEGNQRLKGCLWKLLFTLQARIAPLAPAPRSHAILANADYSLYHELSGQNVTEGKTLL